jgi:FecR protein
VASAVASYFHPNWLLLSAVGFYAHSAEAASLKDGHFSAVVHQVRVTEPGGPPAPAKLSAALRDGSIETGAASRAEVAFGDHSIARLGDNTQLNVDSRSRTFDLTSGAVLTQVPAGVGGTTLKVRNITATATGSTLIIEALPTTYTKFISLDGTSRLCLKKRGWGSDCVLLRAGQMLIAGPEPKSMPDAVDVDLNRLLETCQFITEFSALPGQDRLTKAAAAQAKKKSHGSYADTNLVIFGRGTVVSKRDADDSKVKEQTGSPTPRPSPERSPTAAEDPTR